MVEEQVEVEVPAAHLDVNLATHEGEADVKLHEELLHVVEEPLLEITFQNVLGEGEEVEDVRVLEGLLTRSDSRGSSVSAKFARARPWRWWRRLSICTVSTDRLQPRVATWRR